MRRGTAADCSPLTCSIVYDGMARVTEMRYPNGWVEYYTYDNMGRLLAVDDTHPSEKPAKTQKHTYRYDANGNILREYMRGNGTGQAKNDTSYTYDALNRLVTAHDNYGNSTRTYTYDTLGNLTYETGNGSHNGCGDHDIDTTGVDGFSGGSSERTQTAISIQEDIDMKTNRSAALRILFTISLIAISICSCAANRASSIQYDENLSQTCNHLNSGLIQEYEGVFYELKPADTGFALYKGDEANKTDESVGITTARSGFWIYNDRIFYRAGESGSEIRSSDTDGSEDVLLFTAPVQEFVVSDNGIFWTDVATESLMYYDFTSYNIVTVIGTAASRVYFHLKAEAVRMRE